MSVVAAQGRLWKTLSIATFFWLGCALSTPNLTHPIVQQSGSMSTEMVGSPKKLCSPDVDVDFQAPQVWWAVRQPHQLSHRFVPPSISPKGAAQARTPHTGYIRDCETH